MGGWGNVPGVTSIPGVGGVGDLFGGGGIPGMGGGAMSAAGFPMMGGGFPGMGGGGGGMLGFLSGGNTPMDRGYGLTDQNAPFIPWNPSPGLQQGTPMQGDFNMSGPGAAESYFGQNQGRFTQPGVGQQYQQATQGQFMQPGVGEQYVGGQLNKAAQGPQGLSTNSQQYYDRFQPRTAQEAPGLGTYYDRAKERAFSDVNKAAGARGMFGSTAAMNQLGQTSSDLNAEQANREAQYNLQRLAEDRAWQGLGGNLAGQADTQNRGNSMMDLSWLQGTGDLALGAQNAGLNRLMGGGNMAFNAENQALQGLLGGMNSALGAQGARRNRVQDMFGNLMAPSMFMSGMTADQMGQMLSGDQALMDSSIMFGSGLAREALNQDYRGQERIKDDASWASSLVGDWLPLLSGGM